MGYLNGFKRAVGTKTLRDDLPGTPCAKASTWHFLRSEELAGEERMNVAARKAREAMKKARQKAAGSAAEH